MLLLSLWRPTTKPLFFESYGGMAPGRPTHAVVDSICQISRVQPSVTRIVPAGSSILASAAVSVPVPPFDGAPPGAVVGDSWHRFYVRMLEVVQSIRIVEQAVEKYRALQGEWLARHGE